MNDLLAQIILAARNNDGQGWMNILFVVILAVLWAVGGIIKAKTKKAQEQDEEQLARKPARKPAAGTRASREQFLEQARRPVGPAPGRQYRPGVQQPRTRVVPRRSAIQKLAAQAAQASRLQAIKPPVERRLPIPTPRVQPDFEELPELEAKIEKMPEFTTEAVKGLEDERISIPAEVPEAKHLVEILSDYADPEELRRAILHYEILGRPLSLRGPSEHIIGL